MGVHQSQTLKQLQTRRDKLKVEVDHLASESKEAQAKYSTANNKLKSVISEIKTLQEESKELVISEHAILRYIESLYGISMEDIKAQLLSSVNSSCLKFMKNGKLTTSDNLQLVVKDNTVVTIIDKKP